jgi:mono/diheme cytochrome c family protein
VALFDPHQQVTSAVVMNICSVENYKGAVGMARLALIILMLTVPSVSATAQSDGGNPLIGRQTAATLCVPCHQVDETRRDGAPSFVDIANMPSTTALSLKVFLRSSHKEMPNLIIPNSETDDLIAYILGLRQPSAPRRR